MVVSYRPLMVVSVGSFFFYVRSPSFSEEISESIDTTEAAAFGTLPEDARAPYAEFYVDLCGFKGGGD